MPEIIHHFDRVPDVPDHRDWQMGDYLLTVPSLAAVDAALAAMTKVRWNPATDKLHAWAKEVTAYLHLLTPGSSPPPPAPVPTPPPPPPTPAPAAKLWPDARQLDQGATGHCVGFGWAQWGNTEPVADLYTDNDAHKIYYESVAIEGRPNTEDGAQVRSGAIAMKARNKLSAYVFAASVGEIAQWILTKGSVVFGCNWYADMNMPDPTNGLVNPTGPLLGGHAFVIDGFDSGTTMFRCQNSWGSNWGLNGYFYIFAKDLAKLFAQQGDACAALELAA